MKRLLNVILRGCWRATAPIRRPLARSLGRLLDSLLAQSVRTPILERLDALPRIEDGLRALPRIEDGLRALPRIEEGFRTLSDLEPRLQEMNLALNGLIREVVRLQRQLEVVQQAVDEADFARGLLRAVGPEEAHEFDPMAGERIRIG